jgi:hypothetical protein
MSMIQSPTRAIFILISACLLCGVANAQYARHGDGRMFDANPQIGSGGAYNFGRPASPLMLGNAYATGNVRGGLSLRSVSPISDPTAFRAGLGSSSLSDFIRDSVSVADAATPFRPFSRTTFYDPAVTAPTGGFLRSTYGMASTPTPYTQTATLAGSGIQFGRPAGISLPERGATIPALSVAPTRYGDMGTELSSTLFGPNLRTQPSRSGERSPSVPVLDLLNRELLRTREPGGPEEPDRIGGVRTLLDEQMREPIGRPMDLVMRSDSDRTPRPLDPQRLGDMARVDGVPTNALADGRPGSIAPEPTITPFAGLPQTAAPSPKTPRAHLLAGYDLFTDMRMATSLSRDGGAPWWSAMQESAQGDPSVTRAQLDVLAQDAKSFKEKMLSTPVRSFAGAGEAPINDAMREAELLMSQGRFFDAAARYQQAQAYDPLNPLPLIGRGHAMLAAGDYLQAAIYVVRGLERFPELSRFTVDLQTLLGGGEVVDIRRADLVQQLRVREDVRLRFLLGYLEYHGGVRESGLENLEKAAAGAEPGSIIFRYPTMLRGSGVLPPPQILPVTPSDPLPGESPAKLPGGTP